jgi:lipopolysaccharide exporter
MSRSKKSVISAFYLILDSVFQKLIGLVSTLILARILVPDDFGIIAIAALAYGFIEVFSQTGSNQYVISRQTIDDELVNSAWTLDVMVKLVVFVLMQMAALPVSEYYDNPEIEALFRAYPVLLLLGAFTSPSIWLLIRDQNLKRYFTMQVVAKIFRSSSLCLSH